VTKLMVYTDLHLTAKKPFHRVDDFQATMLAKLKEVYDLGDARGVDHVLFLGDFFNSHRIFSYDLINSAMDIICNAGVDTHALVGQHDLVGRNKDSYASSTLCFMERHCKRFQTMHKPTDLGDVVIYPCHSWDDFPETMGWTVSKRKKSILAAHHLITREKKIFHTYVTDDFLPCQYSAVIFGDYHGGMDPYRHESGTLVWSPGSLARLAINETARKVKVGIMTAVPGQNVEVEELELACAKPGKDVFSETFIESVREHAGLDTSRFVEQIMSIEADAVDIFDLVQKAATQQGVRKEVVDYILSKRP